MNLDAREKRFVDEYLIDLNVDRAAVAAGYSKSIAKSKAYQWVSNSKVKPHLYAYLQERQKALSERIEITQDRVVKELAKIGFADIRNAVRWGPNLGVVDTEDGTVMTNGVLLVDSDKLDADTAAAVSEIAQTAQGVKIKLHDKRAALVDIGRHLGMFTDKVEHTGKNGGPMEFAHMTDADIKRRLKEIDERVVSD